MTLEQPIWFLLLLPIAVAWAAFRLPTGPIRAIRAVVLILIVAALARPAVRVPAGGGTIVVLADRSVSMPAGAEASEKEIVGMAESAMGGNDRLAVVSFGARTAVEHSPGAGKFAGFTSGVGADRSDLHSALEVALSLVPAEESGRVLVISDGQWTGLDPIETAARFAGRNMAIDYRVLERPSADDLSIEQIQAPETVAPGQGYMLSAVVNSPVARQVHYELKRGRSVISSGTRAVEGGLSRITFRDIAGDEGVMEYTATVTGNGDDPVSENNRARILVGVDGHKPVLVVSPRGADSGLARVLKAGGLETRGASAGECGWDFSDLARYSAVIIENTSADHIGEPAMLNMASWVKHAGGGLMITGGRKSYGTGGYYKSPLEPIMPVTMELRREHRKLRVAIVVVLDRSGSMSMPAGGGRTKMDLADIGTVQVLDLLSPADEFGTIAVDSAPHVIVPLDSVEKNAGMRGKILQIESMGGGIFIYEALSSSIAMLMKAQSVTKHILLFADASDSEEPGAYAELLRQALAAGITVSVVGLGTPQDCDAELLRDVAKCGGGECFFTVNPDEIPRLFAQDTFTVSKSTFVESETKFQLNARMKSLSDVPLSAPPPLGGYNLCYPRPEANVEGVSLDEYSAPVVASWHVGAGRVLCFAGEADGQYTGAFGQWHDAGPFYAALAGWAAGKQSGVDDAMQITQEQNGGMYRLEIHLDPRRTRDPFEGTPAVTFLRGNPGQAPVIETPTVRWESADLISAETELDGPDTMLATVRLPGKESVFALPPTCMPYSPEFRSDRERRGRTVLADLAAATGGRERIDIAGIWKDLPRSGRLIDLAPFLALAAIILVLLEVLERRTGILFARRAARTASVVKPEAGTSSPRKSRGIRMTPGRPAKQESATQVEADKKPAEKSPEPESATASAMKQAREKATQRLKM